MSRDILSRKYAIKVAKIHGDNATSKEVRRYWVRVIKSLKNKQENGR